MSGLPPFALTINYLQKPSCPKERLLKAVQTSAVSDLKQLLWDNTIDLNEKFQHPQFAGSTVLHIACSKGKDVCLELLLKTKRPDANIQNNSQKTPLDCAVDNGKFKCAELLLQYVDWPIFYVWSKCLTSVRRNVPSTRIIIMLIRTTPNNLMETFVGAINTYSATLARRHQPNEAAEMMKVFFMTGNSLNQADYEKFIKLHVTPLQIQMYYHPIFPTTEDEEDQQDRTWFLKWHKSYKTQPQTLKHYCRLAVRRSLSDNLFYQIEKLPLPPIIKAYLRFSELSEHENVMGPLRPKKK
jgi:hypothetical protein